jgi:hypothetical protein
MIDISTNKGTRKMTVGKKLIQDSQDFFNRVSILTDKIEVSKACNELLEYLAENYKITTISTNLTEYKKPFKSFIHSLSELNENITVKNGSHTQHCAVSMLTLSDVQVSQLSVNNRESARSRDGFDINGEIREIEIPTTDIASIIKISCDCLTSDNPHIIAAGIVNLTGLRANEQNMPRYDHKNLGVVERKMVVLDEFVIGFQGLSKKRSDDDCLAFYARPTLAPAQLIVDAHNKYLSFNAVQAISTDINKYQKTFQQQFKIEFKKIFGKLFSTVENFDDDGQLIKENGTPHKGRAFYACALRSILKGKYFGSSAINTYVQLSLAHDNIAETMKYLGRYDESLYINPVNINIPTNITNLGKMTIAPIISETVNTIAKGFSLEVFIEGLSEGNQFKMAEILSVEKDVNKAVLKLIESLENNTGKSDVIDETVKKSGLKVATVTDNIAEIVETIMHYNRQIEGDEIKDLAVPSYRLINTINVQLYGKQLAPTTVKTFLESHKTPLDSELKTMGVIEGLSDSSHNGKYHRKTMAILVATILEYRE